MPGRPQEALGELGTDVLLRRAALEADGVVALALGVAQAVERDVALAAEVERGLGAVLEDRHDVAARFPDLVVVLTQLDELLAAEGSPEMAHEGHDQRPVAPALGERDVALAGFDGQVWELVAVRFSMPSLTL